MTGEALQLTLTADSVLSDDFIFTEDVLVDPESGSPVGVFRSGGEPHALFVRADGVLCHLAPNPGKNAAGWSVAEIGGATGVTQAVAGVDPFGVAHGFYTDASSLYHTALVDGKWTAPDPLPHCDGLGVTRNALTAELIAYGVTADGLQLVRQAAGGKAWSATSLPLDSGSLSGAVPVLLTTNAASDWVMAVPGQAASGGQVDLYQGSTSAIIAGPVAVPAPNEVSRVILGYWMNNSALFLFTDRQQNLYTCAGTSGNVVQIAGASVSHAAAVMDPERLLHLYSTDANGVLSVLHQTGWDGDGGPSWAPSIPLDTGFLQLFADTDPADAAAFFAIDQDGALWHSLQDPHTRLRHTAKAQMPAGSRGYRVPQYRTEITVLDASGNPVPSCTLTVTASTTSAILVRGVFLPVGPSKPATVTTGPTGRATISTLAAGVSTPTLTFAAEGLAAPQPVNPAARLHDYLAGNGALNEGTSSSLPPFGADVLTGATVNGKPLAPATQAADTGPQVAQNAVSGIQQIFQTQTGQSARGAEPIVGWVLERGGPAGVSLRTFTRQDEFDAARAALAIGPGGELLGSSWWDHVKHYAEDVWHGIKKGALQVASFAVSVADRACSLAVKIGDELQHLGKLVLKGIEEVAAAVQSVFNWIGAEIKDLIDWLKMLFDWHDISDTARVLHDTLVAGFPRIRDHLVSAEAQVNGFFAAQEQRVSDAFDRVIARYAHGETLSAVPPTTTSPVLKLAAADIQKWVKRAENNWLFEKLESYLGDHAAFRPVPALAPLFDGLQKDFEPAVHGFQAALDEFVAFFRTALQHPSQLSTVGVAELLTAARELALAALEFLDAVVEAFLQLVATAFGAIKEILTAPLDVPYFSSLWGDLGSRPGARLPGLSMAGLLCTALAIPVTLFYKSQYGSHSAPFPGGVIPSAERGTAEGGALTSSAAQKACQFTGVCIAALWAGFDTGLDAVPDVELKVFSVIDMVAPALLNLFTWPGDADSAFVPFTAIPLGSDLDRATFVTWLSNWGVVGLDAALLLAGSIAWMPESKIARYQDPAGKILMSGVGTVTLAAGIVASSLGASRPAVASNILGPLPPLAQCLRLKSADEASEGLTPAIKLVIDFFTGMGNAVAIAAA